MKWMLIFLLLAFGPACAQTAPTANDKSQDRAVVKDQRRQDSDDARQNATVKADNAAQDAASKAVDNRQDVKLAKAVGRIDEITDRQFMLVMTATLGLLLVAIWLILQRGASRQHTASNKLQAVADKLMARINILEKDPEE